MASPQEARVPDIGDFDEVPVIDGAGVGRDTVSKDRAWSRLIGQGDEEVPAPFAGVVRK